MRGLYLLPILIVTLFSLANAYSLEGTWQLIDKHSATKVIQSYSPGPHGTTTHLLTVENCSTPIRITPHQSILAIDPPADLDPHQDCTTDDSRFLMGAITRDPFLHFEIYYNHLTLTDLHDTQKLLFTSATPACTQVLPGQYTYLATQTPLSISPDTISACNDTLELEYENKQNSVLDVQGYTVQRCQDGDAADIMGKVEGAKYFRIENPNTMQFYDSEYRPVVALRKDAEWVPTDPAQGANVEEGEVVIAGEGEESQVPQETVTTTQSESENKGGSVQTPQTEQRSSNGAVPIVNGQPSEANGQQSNGNSQDSGDSNNEGAQQAPVNDSPSQTTQQPVNSNSQSQDTTPSSESVSGSSGSQSSSNQPSSSNPSTPSTSSSSSQGSQPSSASGSSSSSSPSSSGSASTQPSTAGAVSAAPGVPTGYTEVVLSQAQLAGNYEPVYLKNIPTNLYPRLVRYNGTSLLLQACNILSVPLIVNPDTQKVRTSDPITLTRIACGDIDTPLAETVTGADHLTAHTNNDTLLVTFRDENGEALFSMQRALNDGEKDNFKLKNAPQPTDSSSEAVNRNSQASSNANGAQTQSGQQAGSAAQSAQTVSIANFLVGRYNPQVVYSATLPQATSKRYEYTFSRAFILLSGTCYRYRYPYTATDSENSQVIEVNKEQRLIQQNSNCDPADDLLFTRIIEDAETIQLTLSQDGVVALVIFDGSGARTGTLVRQELANPQ